MSNVTTVPKILMVVQQSTTVGNEIARLWAEADWCDAYMIEPQLVADVPPHLLGMDKDALRAHRATVVSTIEGLHQRPFDEAVKSTFSVKQVGEALSSSERVVGFNAEGKFFFDEDTARPSDEELSELTIEALRVLLAA